MAKVYLQSKYPCQLTSLFPLHRAEKKGEAAALRHEQKQKKEREKEDEGEGGLGVGGEGYETKINK